MKFIEIRENGDVIGMFVTNEDSRDEYLQKLFDADKHNLFEFAVYEADTFHGVLAYVERTNDNA